MITFETEIALYKSGLIGVGIDEAGRGALAGPVVAAAVILDRGSLPDGINDSKKLSPQERAALAAQIRQEAIAWGLGVCSAQHIDKVNILQATFDAMHAAIDYCRARLNDSRGSLHLLVDGNRFRPHAIAHTTIIGGDGLVMSIAAASILAKTHRDEIMTDVLGPLYPLYEFNRHKGYGTNFHRDVLRMHGPCSEHRQSFLGKIFTGSVMPSGTTT